MGSAASTPLCSNAVIVLPGIMGSELVEQETSSVLWGFAARRYVDLWTSGTTWEKLKVSERERDGKADRVKATKLLRASAFAPLLRGAEPYSKLLAGIRAITVHPDAVLEFPYDWRLSVAYNASVLADVAERHLKNWRTHSHGRTDAKLVLVAHSMGGLIARFFTGLLGGNSEVSQTITIGTPFQGAVKAVFVLDRGQGGPLPLPRQRLQELARTLPGIYDLLPSYRCVEADGAVRRLTPPDVHRLGGDMDLARGSARLYEMLATHGLSDLRTLVGVEQHTMQSLRLRNGMAEAQYFIHEDDGRIDWGGDGTVYSQVASGGVEPVSSLPQSHGALARSPETIAAVRAVLTRRRLGPPMGAAAIGLNVPDSVVAGEPFEISVTSSGDPGGARCRIVDADTGIQVDRPFLAWRDKTLRAVARFPRPGVYRVEANSGGFSPVTQLVLALPTAGLKRDGASR